MSYCTGSAGNLPFIPTAPARSAARTARSSAVTALRRHPGDQPREREPEAKRPSHQKEDRPDRVRPRQARGVQSGVSQMPPRRCVVIGAGVLGASVAARLAAAGMQVTLLEADQPGRATSRWSFAWLNSNNKAPRPYHDLNQAGMRAWAELAPDLDGAAWYRAVGHVELAASEAGQSELAARVERLTEWGYPARLIDA